jgi:hypothetical protein
MAVILTWRSSLLSLMLAVGSACQLLPATVVLFGAVTALAQNVDQRVAPLNSKPYGKTYGEWAAAWGQWNEAIPYGVNPAQRP